MRLNFDTDTGDKRPGKILTALHIKICPDSLILSKFGCLGRVWSGEWNEMDGIKENKWEVERRFEEKIRYAKL